jgi:hypothetical protein
MVLNPTPTGAQVVVLAGSRTQAVTLEQARPAIEQFLLNDRKRQLVEKELKDMRAAAKIEYVGKYAAEAASAPASARPDPTVASPVVPAASSGLSASDISKGLGIK